MAALTAKQEKFCQNVAVKNMTYSDAYRNAYDCKEATNKSINELSSTLKAKVNISSRIDKLKEETKDAVIKEAVYGYKEHMAELELLKNLALAEAEESKKELNIALKAMELKGKVSELYNFTQNAKTDITSGGEPVKMGTIVVDGTKQDVKMGS